MASFHFPPVLRLAAVTLTVSLAGIFISRVWQVNTLPYSLNFVIALAKTQNIALDCLVGFIFILMFKTIFISLCRLFSKAADATLGIEGPFLRANINSLSNDIEQGFLFFINLLVATTFSDFTPERAVVLSAIFIGARVLYWIGYILNVYVHYLFRLPGVALSGLTTLSLVYFNLTHIF
mmetsp:Transcript_33035/g.58191  ORF Transcript_33035/g.58191 Transcript_33035/m.58191 type:complete len:179 (+) Transcript_33035:2639-3175(+)